MFKTDYTQNFQLIAPLAAGAIAAGVQAIGSGTQSLFQGKMNRKTRKFAEKEREIQRQYALQDYATMNEYNSPRAQMARFKEAGLNPNLIYGQTNEGATVRSTEQAKWNPETPQFDVGSALTGGIQTYNDLRMANANLDLIAKEGAVKTADVAYKTAMTSQVAAQTAKTEWEAKTAESIANYSAQTAEANLRKIMTDTAFTAQQIDINLQKNEREALSNAQSLREGVIRMAQMRIQNAKTQAETENAKAMLKNIETDNKLKEADIRLKDQNLQPGDPLIIRQGTLWYKKYLEEKPYRDEERRREKQEERYPHGPKNPYYTPNKKH